MTLVSDFAAFRAKKAAGTAQFTQPQVEVYQVEKEVSEEQLQKIVNAVEKKLPKQQTQPAALNSGFGITHHQVNSAEFVVSSWMKGYNILGVIYDGPVTIWLPKKLKKAIIAIKDERGDAATNNITVKVKQ